MRPILTALMLAATAVAQGPGAQLDQQIQANHAALSARLDALQSQLAAIQADLSALRRSVEEHTHDPPPPPPPPPPPEDRLLQQADFEYLGAIRVPPQTFGIARFAYGGRAMAFLANDPATPDDDTLLVSGHVWYPGAVAEINIPAPVDAPDVAALNTATVLQPFADVTEGKIQQVKGANSVKLGGLMMHGGQVIWTAFDTYDAGGDATVSHGTASPDWSVTGEVRGMFRVGSTNPGVVAGYMCTVPQPWRDRLGVPMLTGQANLNIITRTSAGPALVGFDPADLAASESDQPEPVPGLSLLYYPVDESLGGDMGSQNPLFNFNSTVGGCVFPMGSRSVVFFGGHATGEVCYGTPEECEDPVRGGKGWHDKGGNYVYQAWAYDANDLLAVKNGEKPPQSVQPYTTWRPTFHMMPRNAILGGVAYDAATGRVFVLQQYADTSQYELTPLIHVYRVQ